MLPPEFMRPSQTNGCVVVPALFSQSEADTYKEHFMRLRVQGTQPGDMLFRNGQLIHGSFPNTSKTRFRRSLIGHYIAAEAQKVGGFYDPVPRMDGTRVVLEHNAGGGPCGLYRGKADGASLEMVQPVEPELVGHE